MSKKKFYGLFVGVDKYESGSVASLNGCVNDALKIYNYLERAINRTEYDFIPKKLFSTNDANIKFDILPTRTNILDSLKEFSVKGKLAKGDVVFFFYAGHGSTEAAHPYFGEANGEVQTLVPCDARTLAADGKKVRDVLDKEIRYLVNQIWENSGQQAEIIIIQDSCHSTGATRSVTKEAELKIAEELLAIKKRENTEGATATEVVAHTEINFDFSGDEMPDFGAGTGENIVPQQEELVLDEAEQPTMRMCAAFGKEDINDANAERTVFVPVRGIEDMYIFDEETKKEIAAATTRGTVTENTDNRANPFKTENTNTEGSSTRSAGAGSGTEVPFDKKFPLGNHIHMAACEKNQYAYEAIQSDGQKGGIFTDTLVKILERSGGNISYHEIFNRAKSMIDGIFNQTPSLFIKGDQQKRYEKFLGGKATVKEGEFTISVQKRNGKDEWVVEAGALLGLNLLREGQNIAITVFNANNPTESYQASIEVVLAECSLLGGNLPPMDTKNLYKARIDIAQFVNYPINVLIEGDNNPMNNYINLPEAEYFKTFVEWNGANAKSASYSLQVDAKGRFALCRQGTAIPVLFPSRDTSAKSALELMSQLKNISRWHQLQALATPHPGAKDLIRNHLFALSMESGEVLYTALSDAFPFYQWRYAKDFASIGMGNNLVVKKIKLPLPSTGSGANVNTGVRGTEVFKSGTSGAREYVFIARQIAGTAAADKNLYMGVLSMGYDFSVLSLSDSGSALFPSYEPGKETQIRTAISTPRVVSQGLTNTVTNNLKVMLAYKRFDPSNWLQDALQEYSADDNNAAAGDATRAVLQLKAGSRTQDWIALTLEIEFTTEVDKIEFVF